MALPAPLRSRTAMPLPRPQTNLLILIRKTQSRCEAFQQLPVSPHLSQQRKRDAERALSEIIASIHSGSYIESTKQNLSEFVTEWLAAIEPTVRPATHYSYSRNLRLHVHPRLG
jgi:hypothetical protein